MIILKEYEGVKEELEKITLMASGEDEFRIEDMRATLSIYRVLLEEIYSSQPHFKVLFLLHGATDEMTVDQIKGASGIGGVAILRAIHELNRAELISFDEDTHVVKLLKRFFPKKIKKTE
jgi:predicted transcriptional regulator